MKPKTMILMVVAIVCGLGASYMTSRLLAERDDTPPEAVVKPKVTLIVANKNLGMHTPLSTKPQDFFINKEVFEEDAPKDALTPADFPKLKGKFVKRGLRKGDHILLEDLTDGKIGLDQLPNGMRAVGIQVTMAATAGGFASLPGSHVDIVWTSRQGGNNESFAKVLLEDVIVLAADTNNKGDQGGAIVASVVTVAVTPDDSLKLILAMDSGALKLSVRNLDDKSTTEKERVTFDQLVKEKINNKEKVIAAIAPPVVDTKPEPVLPKEATQPDPPPQPKLTKMTVSVRNGQEYQLHHYWIDEDDRIVTPPAGFDPMEYDPVPQTKGKKDDSKKIDTKKDDSKKDGSGL